MKFLSKSWKLGVSLFLCTSLISMTALAAGQTAGPEPIVESEDRTEAVVETEEQEQTESEAARAAEPDEADAEETKNVIMETKEEIPEAEEEIPEAEEDTEEVPVPGNSLQGREAAEETVEAKKETEPGTVVKSGDCGFSRGSLFYKVTYLGNDQYGLTIYGTGKMLTIGATYGAPWHKYSEDVVSIELQEGLESVSQFAFTDCDQVSQVTIPASVTALYKNSFQMRGLKEVYFLGSWSDKFNAGAFDRAEDLKISYNQNDASWTGKSFTNATIQGQDLSLIKVEALDPSCTTDGNPLYYYSETWDKYFSDEEGRLEITDKEGLVIPAYGHDWDEGTVTKEPTVTEEGEITYTCLRCNETRPEAIAALPDEDVPDEDVPDAEIPGPEEDAETISINLNLSLQEQAQNSRTGQTSAEPVSAGMVKTADENNQILYLALLIICGIVIFIVIRRRINRN